MKRTLFRAALLGLAAIGALTMTTLLPAAAQSSGSAKVAAVETRTLAVENMTCALCPITVRKAMQGVAGVKSVAVDLESGTATVVFDPSVTNANAIVTASTNAGYRASVKR